jgi:hypothetical protein
MARMSGMSRGTAQPLRQALQRARIEAAERGQSVVAVRDADFARLELLKDALQPVVADVPADVDLFDLAIAPGEPPRLFIDMVAHVAIDRDRRLYRLVRDTRSGRQVLAESADQKLIVAAATAYIARRMVEREQILAESSPEPPVAEMPGEPEPGSASVPEPVARRLLLLLAFLVGAVLGAGLMVALR